MIDRILQGASGASGTVRTNPSGDYTLEVPCTFLGPAEAQGEVFDGTPRRVLCRRHQLIVESRLDSLQCSVKTGRTGADAKPTTGNHPVERRARTRSVEHLQLHGERRSRLLNGQFGAFRRDSNPSDLSCLVL